MKLGFFYMARDLGLMGPSQAEHTFVWLHFDRPVKHLILFLYNQN